MYEKGITTHCYLGFHEKVGFIEVQSRIETSRDWKGRSEGGTQRGWLMGVRGAVGWQEQLPIFYNRGGKLKKIILYLKIADGKDCDHLNHKEMINTSGTGYDNHLDLVIPHTHTIYIYLYYI